MRKVFLALLLAFFSAPALAALSVDDFIPPVQAVTEAERAELLKVREPGAVQSAPGELTSKPAISAKSAQDAVNAWVAKRVEGFEEILFPSGFGFVTTAVGAYEKLDNPVATRVSKRNAYVRAYMGAKRQLAEGLKGLLTQGNTRVSERIATVNESLGQTLVNVEELTVEGIQQRIDGFLRGYVVYDVFDDVSAARVYLTLVTTPKTQGRYNRPDPSSIAAASVQEGLAQALAEVERGLTPPVGGMTVFVPATGELAFVGFGSAVIGRQDNAAVQAKLELNAERVAKIRAKDSLCGVIVGEEVAASEKVDSEIGGMSKDFRELTQDDPAVKANPDHPGYERLQTRKTAFKAAEVNQTTITGARQGVLPPGVRQQSWMDEDKAFAYAVAIYMPSASEQAAKGAASMESGTILQPVGGGGQPIPTDTPREDVKQGPSGAVQNPNGL
ncbi:MAG: hypothetical protein LBD04_03220 [Synergistaceae bacterium]|jgi:hypothetical protein|nr:hypothetical protein [Synergistaceae bacterium]